MFDSRPMNARLRTCRLLAVYFPLLSTLVFLAGCPSGVSTSSSTPVPVTRSMGGGVYGGRQPISGATVVAYAASTTAGAAPTELGSAVTDSSGKFHVTFSPSPATGQVVYVTATGGNAGSGSSNSAIGLMTVAGIRGSTLAPVAGTVNVTELTTVATTAALQRYLEFADCSTIVGNSRSGICVSLPGAVDLARVVASISDLVDPVTGQASDFLASPAQTTGSPIHLTWTKLDTLANALAGCVNSAGTTSSACRGLFAATHDNAHDTLLAAYDIATSPVIDARASALYDLGVYAGAPFSPVLSARPASTVAGFWTVSGHRFIYTANNSDDTVSIQRISPLTGAMQNVQTAVSVGKAPYAVAVTPNGRFAYVTNQNSQTVSAYAIDPGTGGLVPVHSGGAGPCGVTPDPDNCFASGQFPQSIQADPTGRYLYVEDYDGDKIFAYRIDSVTGALTANGSVATGTQPFLMAMTPDGENLYVPNAGDGTVSAYRIMAGGALTSNGAALATGTYPTSVTVGPKGRYLYVANSDISGLGQGTIGTYAIGAGGSLSLVANATDNNAPVLAAIDPRDRYAYVIHGNGLSAYRVEATGALTALAAATIPISFPQDVKVDPGGRFVYVSSGVSDTVAAYAVAPETAAVPGALTQISLGRDFAVGYSQGVIADTSGRYVYASNSSAHTVTGYRIDPVTGALVSEVAGSPFSSGGTATMLADAPDSRFLYAGNADGSIAAFGQNPSTGGLNALTGSPFAGPANGYALRVSPDGQFVYVAGQSSNVLVTYRLDAATGVPTQIASTPTGNRPGGLTEDPSGHYLYVANQGGGISAYAIAQAGGAATVGVPVAITNGGAASCSVTPDPGNCFGTLETNGLAIDSSGTDLYATSSNANVLASWTIASASSTHPGALTALTASSYTSCTSGGPANCLAMAGSPFMVAMTPNGDHLYVNNRASVSGHSVVSAYAVASATSATPGVLNPVTAGAQSCGTTPDPMNCYPTGADPYQVSTGPLGHYLYTANPGDDTVSVFTIDNATGQLTPFDISSPFTVGNAPFGMAVTP